MSPLLSWTGFLTLGLFTGFYGTSTGGAGLLAIPVLIFAGLTAQGAVATATIGYLGLALAGLHVFHEAKRVRYAVALPAIAAVTIGAIAGSLITVQIPSDTLKPLIGWIVLALLILSVVNPSIGLQERTTSILAKTIGYPLFLLVGIFSAFTGTGGAMLGCYVLMLCFGETYIGSAGTNKPISIAKHISVATTLGIQGLINWPIAFPLLAGNIVGAYFGSHYAMRKGERFVRWLFIVITGVSAALLIL